MPPPRCDSQNLATLDTLQVNTQPITVKSDDWQTFIAINKNMDITKTPTTNNNYVGIDFRDVNGIRCAWFGLKQGVNGVNEIQIQKQNSNFAKFVVDCNPPANSSGNEMLPAKWFKAGNSQIRTVIDAGYDANTGGFYRVWNDGWIEQGRLIGGTTNTSGWAETTITLYKAYGSTNYIIFAEGNWSDTPSSSCSVKAKTTTNFSIRYAQNYVTIHTGNWYCCGH